jgi:hypothetical protein
MNREPEDIVLKAVMRAAVALLRDCYRQNGSACSDDRDLLDRLLNRALVNRSIDPAERGALSDARRDLKFDTEPDLHDEGW